MKSYNKQIGGISDLRSLYDYLQTEAPILPESMNHQNSIYLFN